VPAAALLTTLVGISAPTVPRSSLDSVLTAVRSAANASVRTRWVGFAYAGSDAQGGLPGRVSGLVRFADGRSISRFRSGSLTIAQGFNGTAWVAKNGIVGRVDVPGLYRDSVTGAYIAAEAWLNLHDDAAKRYIGRLSQGGITYDLIAATPPRGSTAILWFDAATHRLNRTVVQSDYGPDRTDYSGYRDVEGMVWPFTATEQTASGSTTVTQLSSFRLIRAASTSLFATPKAEYVGQAPGTVTIPISSDARTYMAHILLRLRVGTQSLIALFDSGGQNSLLPAAARRLRVRTGGSIDVGGSGEGSESASIADVGTIALGKASLAGQRFIVLPLPYQIVHPSHDITVDGVVGAEFLQNFRVRIDYARRRLSLSPFSLAAVGGGVALPFLSDGSHAYIWASIDGKRGLFSLDTGDSSSITLFAPFAERNHLYTSGGVRYVGLGIGGSDAEDEYRARNFSIAGFNIGAPIVRVARASAGDFSSRSVAGNIGADVLSRFTVTFDYHARTVTFLPNASLRRPFREDMTGLTVGQRSPESFHVVSVAAASPAADAGIRAGDDIINVNGTPVTLMGVKDFDVFRFGSAAFTVRLRDGHATHGVTVRPRPLLRAD